MEANSTSPSSMSRRHRTVPLQVGRNISGLENIPLTMTQQPGVPCLVNDACHVSSMSDSVHASIQGNFDYEPMQNRREVLRPHFENAGQLRRHPWPPSNYPVYDGSGSSSTPAPSLPYARQYSSSGGEWGQMLGPVETNHYGGESTRVHVEPHTPSTLHNSPELPSALAEENRLHNSEFNQAFDMSGQAQAMPYGVRYTDLPAHFENTRTHSVHGGYHNGGWPTSYNIQPNPSSDTQADRPTHAYRNHYIAPGGAASNFDAGVAGASIAVAPPEEGIPCALTCHTGEPCPKRLLNKGDARQHFRHEHIPQGYSDRCPWPGCHNAWDTRSRWKPRTRDGLIRHLVGDAGFERVSCTICPESFSRQDALIRHMRRAHRVKVGGP